ncbi:hypothetical protein EV385_3650 [Krasilnikovia cinnamomea]|uniref:Uncharacterized protein n=1 Tax=Krasilnikovia cinnamomea TaxID=349313 RepID=A0A4Q7ZN76_9ACTN|nr:hypothetical protein [Krasilnikovia cinnamomea]RZU51815.1 hypothetical protein EV385_3650 [Krasilnikovia cinnamomea]
MSRLAKILTAVAASAAVVLTGTVAHAVITGRTGTFTDQQRYVHQSDAWSTSSAAFVGVPGAITSIVVPSGTRKMIDARFSAESFCAGGGWCSVRIVVIRPNGTFFEMSPQVGTDFAFDSGSGTTDNWESHAIERTSPFLSAGTYRVQVQAGVVAGATSLRLDDWTLAVERVRP